MKYGFYFIALQQRLAPGRQFVPIAKATEFEIHTA
jgi:hypothetical protein